MYKRVKTPDWIIHENGDKDACVALLADGYGARAAIIVDDGCYVLCIEREHVDERGHKEQRFTPIRHWFKEAVEVLRDLPTNPRAAVS